MQVFRSFFFTSSKFFIKWPRFLTHFPYYQTSADSTVRVLSSSRCCPENPVRIFCPVSFRILSVSILSGVPILSGIPEKMLYGVCLSDFVCNDSVCSGFCPMTICPEFFCLDFVRCPDSVEQKLSVERTITGSKPEMQKSTCLWIKFI